MGLCQWDRAVPGLSPHRTENTVLVAELTMSAPWRCSPCPGDSQGLSPRAGPLGAVLEGCGVWGIAGGCSHLVPARAVLSLCNHHPSPVLVGAGHLWLISCCLHLHTWLLYRNGDLHGYNLDPLILFSSVASPACPSCWAQPELLPARQEPTLLHPAPECGLQHGQAGARGRYQGAGRMGGDPMTLSHDLSPPRAALMGLSLPRS